MARVQYGSIITQVAGSIGGVTYQRNAAGSIARARVSPAVVGSGKLINAPIATFNLIQAWRALDQSQIDSWDSFAAAHTRENKFGQTKTLSGFNWFISLNSNLAIVGSSLIEDPPTYTPPDALTYVLVDIIDQTTSPVMTVDFTPNPIPSDTSFVLYTTPWTIPTGLSFNSILRQTIILPAGSIGDFDISTAYTNTHNLPISLSPKLSANVGFLGYFISTINGLTSPAFKATNRVNTYP